MTPIRILKVVQAYYPFQERGGPVVKVRSLALGLAKRGHSVTIITSDLGLNRFPDLSARFERCEWGWRFREEGVEAIYLPAIAHYRALTINPSVLGFCRSSLPEFDMVHFYGLYDLLGPSIGHFCRRHSIPYAIEPMGMFRPIDRAFRRKRFWHKTLGRPFLRGAAQFVATSEMERRELLDGQVPPAKIRIRYNGVDSNLLNSCPRRGVFRTKWNLPSGEPLVLFLSRLIPRKGADMLIEAFAQACPLSGRLIVAGPEGESGYRCYLERRARESRVEQRVIFTGPLYDEDKQAALVDSDLFVLPSRYENFANAAAEAIAFGVPVVVTTSCGIGSLIDGRAGLVIPPQKQALVQALRNVLRDATLYQRLRDGCREVAAQFDWSRLSQQMEGVYLEMLTPGQLNGGAMLRTLVSS